MSGGHFEYKQYWLGEIADEIEQLIIDNDKEADPDVTWDYGGAGYSEETLEKFREGMELLRKAQVFVQRIDWLVSGDDGEESFHKRLEGDLKKL